MSAPPRTASSGNGGCDHIGLFTNDTGKLVAFYREGFGFEVSREEVLPPELTGAIFGLRRECLFTKMSPPSRTGGTSAAPAVTIEIFQPLGGALPERDPGTVGPNHWGLRVGDRTRAAEVLSSLGIPVIEVPRGDRSIYFTRDPDGNLIELRD